MLNSEFKYETSDCGLVKRIAKTHQQPA